MTEDATSPDTAAADPDPEDLQRQLSAIKSAMGLSERYPGQRRVWLVAGVGVGLASVVTNVSFAFDLPFPGLLYPAIWFALAAVLVGAGWRLSAQSPADATLPGPNWTVIFGALVVGLLSLWTSLGDLVATSTTGVARGAHYFSHVLVLLGIGFVVTGAALRAQRIRRRDRVPFYVGGAWILVLAAFVPHVEVLRYWGYAVFGVAFAVHAAGTYLLVGN